MEKLNWPTIINSIVGIEIVGVFTCLYRLDLSQNISEEKIINLNAKVAELESKYESLRKDHNMLWAAVSKTQPTLSPEIMNEYRPKLSEPSNLKK